MDKELLKITMSLLNKEPTLFVLLLIRKIFE
jgi:hypothetical protein